VKPVELRVVAIDRALAEKEERYIRVIVKILADAGQLENQPDPL
jgi:hypothetical protein